MPFTVNKATTVVLVVAGTLALLKFAHQENALLVAYESDAKFSASSSSREGFTPLITKARIRAQLIHQLPLHGVYPDGTDVFYRCHVGEPMGHFMYDKWGGQRGSRQALPGPVLNRTSVLDAHVKIDEAMDLKLLVVGNSLSDQLHAGLAEAVCFPLPADGNLSA
jgi:hypothetical protein